MLLLSSICSSSSSQLPDHVISPFKSLYDCPSHSKIQSAYGCFYHLAPRPPSSHHLRLSFPSQHSTNTRQLVFLHIRQASSISRPFHSCFSAWMLFPQTSPCSISHFPLLKCTFSVELTPAALFKIAIHLCWSPYSPFMAFVFYTAHTTIRITDLFHLLALSLNWLISSIRLEVCFSFWYELFTVISPVSKTVTGM